MPQQIPEQTVIRLVADVEQNLLVLLQLAALAGVVAFGIAWLRLGSREWRSSCWPLPFTARARPALPRGIRLRAHFKDQRAAVEQVARTEARALRLGCGS